ncbi:MULTISPECIES: hypothetical protein [unclassified Enterococcus]|uniref:hypothetical protein n=1 Tax=unclassified Enterococcus TaxID=2608891 RepID=UPI001CE0AA87|nr:MULTISPECIES: hypothetical protein [unclassified Enterococcus]MCA5013388.1 hypothetical protein [Enterococcus sp. S23]MCA5016638.1 hypothetical protein [Enterococcus sp. S22(2020)]
MRTISKRQRQSEKEERSTVLCKEVDPDYLGREVYADDVETPYAFYLVRKLNLAKDYQNLAEGEAFFDAICDSWDETEDFEELVVKKIYMYVETEVMYYTLLMGSFEPTRRELRMNLKKWFEEITLEPTERSLVSKSQSELNTGEIQGMMKQMIETSNEIFRLRKMINELTETINSSQMQLQNKQSHPVISRNIQTIHLKRAQPLVIEEEKKDTETPAEPSEVAVEAELIDETETPETLEEVQTKTEDEAAREPEKKLANELAEKPVQEDFPAEEPTVYPNQEVEDKTEEVEPSVSKKERNTIKLKRNKSALEPKPVVDENEVKSPAFTPVDLSSLVFKKRNTKKATPSNWPRFSKLLKSSKTVDAPAKIPNFSKTEMENLEDEIYLRFMNKRMRLGAKKNHVQKKSILRSELLAQINQAEYLNYSWGQVVRIRKEDVLICGRLSCASLVSSLDEFLQEMRELAYSRSLFGKKVRCSVDLLRRLEGYILMDQYMQNLSLMPVEK